MSASTAARMLREAGVTIRPSGGTVRRIAEIRRKTLGHADQALTSHYTHIEAQAHLAAAEAVARLVEEAGS